VQETPKDAAWMLQGLCRGLEAEVFFPPDSDGVETAQRICAECPVRVECLDHALRYAIADGVWGGTSQRERVRIRSRVHVDAP
jgi:WhiB family redox-sensing transcriptional regulator